MWQACNSWFFDYYSNFQLIFDNKHIVYAMLQYIVGSENSRQPLNQSDTKLVAVGHLSPCLRFPALR